MKRAYIYFAWFLALNGMTRYYPCWQTGQLKRSRYLQYYSIVHNMLTVCGMPLVLEKMQTRETVLSAQVKSNWIHMGTIVYFLLYLFLIISCVYTSQFLFTSLYRIIRQLQSLNRVKVTPQRQRYMTIIIYSKFLLAFCYICVHVFSFFLRFYQAGLLQKICYVYTLNSVSMTTATSLMIYAILWKSCYSGIGLQEQLKKLLDGKAELADLHQLYRQQQCLIAVCNEFCVTFRHLLLWYPIRTLCTGVICGYYLIATEFGQSNPTLNAYVALILILVMLHSFIEFYNLNNLAGDVANFIPTILTIFRQSQPQAEPVERAVSLLNLYSNYNYLFLFPRLLGWVYS